MYDTRKFLIGARCLAPQNSLCGFMTDFRLCHKFTFRYRIQLALNRSCSCRSCLRFVKQTSHLLPFRLCSSCTRTGLRRSSITGRHCECRFCRGAVLRKPWRSSFSRSGNSGCMGSATSSGPKRSSSTGTLCEFRFRRGTLLCDSRRPSSTSSHLLWAKKSQLHKRTLRYRILSWHPAFRFQEAELHQQALRLLYQRHCPSLRAAWTRLHQMTLRVRMLSRHRALRSQEAELYETALATVESSAVVVSSAPALKTLRQQDLWWYCTVRSQEAELHQARSWSRLSPGQEDPAPQPSQRGSDDVEGRGTPQNCKQNLEIHVSPYLRRSCLRLSDSNGCFDLFTSRAPSSTGICGASHSDTFLESPISSSCVSLATGTATGTNGGTKSHVMSRLSTNVG